MKHVDFLDIHCKRLYQKFTPKFFTIDGIFYRLSELSNAQFDVVQALSEWLVRDREQLAEQAFRRWTLRKESQHLQAAQQEWNMARVRRKKVEQKLREKLAMLRAKAKCKFQEKDFLNNKFLLTKC